jgi:hypothetical protein
MWPREMTGWFRRSSSCTVLHRQWSEDTVYSIPLRSGSSADGGRWRQSERRKKNNPPSHATTANARPLRTARARQEASDCCSSSRRTRPTPRPSTTTCRGCPQPRRKRRRRCCDRCPPARRVGPSPSSTQRCAEIKRKFCFISTR